MYISRDQSRQLAGIYQSSQQIICHHIFDKETEITILARNQENKAEIEALQAKRAEEVAAKAAAEAEKLAAEEAKAAAEAEKQRIKMEKKLAKKNKIVDAPVEEVAEEAKDAE